MADNKEDIRGRLKIAREALGLQSKEFATKAGIAQGNYSAMENGERSIGDKILIKISDKLSININWLRTGSGRMLDSPQNDFSQFTEKEMSDMIADGFSDYLMKMYKDGEIYSAEMVKKLIAEKDAKIEELQKRIWKLEQSIK